MDVLRHDPRMIQRDLILRAFSMAWPKMLFRTTLEDEKVVLAIRFAHWKGNTSLVFYFLNDEIESVFRTELPDVIDTTKKFIHEKTTVRERLTLVTEFVREADQFVSFYGIAHEICQRLRVKYEPHGYEFGCFFRLDVEECIYMIVIHLPNIGNCSFDITREGALLFTMEPIISKKIFGIHDKKEDSSKWRNLKKKYVNSAGYMNILYTMVGLLEQVGEEGYYQIIDRALEHSLQFRE
jgi:hypothetical protein